MAATVHCSEASRSTTALWWAKCQVPCPQFCRFTTRRCDPGRRMISRAPQCRPASVSSIPPVSHRSVASAPSSRTTSVWLMSAPAVAEHRQHVQGFVQDHAARHVQTPGPPTSKRPAARRTCRTRDRRSAATDTDAADRHVAERAPRDRRTARLAHSSVPGRADCHGPSVERWPPARRVPRLALNNGCGQGGQLLRRQRSMGTGPA